MSDRYLDHNRRLLAGEAFEVPEAKQHVAVVACMDSRLDVHAILGLGAGEAHVIRNAGGIITDDAIRSLVISQRLLGTTEIVLMHHTGCGMLTFTDDALREEIAAEAGYRPLFAFGAFTDLAQDVRESIRRIMATPFIPHKNDVRGFIFDITSGELAAVSP